MKKIMPFTLILGVLLIPALACSTGSPDLPTITPNPQATIDAAIEATANAQAGIQATIDASVASTAIAMPPTPTQGPTVEVVAMTEEELEALIDETVKEAVAATQQTSNAATQATADNAITSEELASLYDYYYLADQTVALAEEYIEAYYGLYADLAYETLDLLETLEEDLTTTAQSLDEINNALTAINDTLTQGLTLAETTIEQLNNAAQEAATHLQEAQTQSQNWLDASKQEREALIQNIASLQPDSIPSDKLSALQSAFSYVDLVKNAFGDNKISRAELSSIAQLGANAAAGLSANGGPQLQSLAGKLTEITAQIAGGQLPQAKDGLRSFEAALGERPSFPNPLGSGSPLGGGNLPGGGSLPNPGGGGGILPKP